MICACRFFVINECIVFGAFGFFFPIVLGK